MKNRTSFKFRNNFRHVGIRLAQSHKAGLFAGHSLHDAVEAAKHQPRRGVVAGSDVRLNRNAGAERIDHISNCFIILGASIRRIGFQKLQNRVRRIARVRPLRLGLEFLAGFAICRHFGWFDPEIKLGDGPFVIDKPSVVLVGQNQALILRVCKILYGRAESTVAGHRVSTRGLLA